MSIDSIGASTLSSLTQIPPNPAVQGVGGDTDGDNDSSVGGVSGGHHKHGGGGAFMKSVLQALGQSGINLGDQSSPSSDVSQAMHAFMHALFGAMHVMNGSQASGTAESAQASGATGNSEGNGQTGGVASGYSSPATTLQNLIQTLGSGQDGAPNPAVVDLQNAFQNLLTAVNRTAPTANGSSPTLQSFLQNLLPDLSTQQNLHSAAVGNLANTSA